MLINNADITGSFFYNGVNISNVTGSSASLTALNQFSASINLFTGSYNTGSFTGSFIGNGSGLNGVVSASHATTARSASYALTATSSSYALVSTSGSYALTATSASQASNANTATSASQASNAITSSYAANADLLDGIDSTRFAVTSSNTFTGTQYVSATNNAVGFTSTASIYTDGGLRVTKDAYVSGTIYVNNLTVYGTQSVNYITSSQLNIGTNIITVNTDVPAIRFGGLAVYDSGSTRLTGSMLWDSEQNRWVYSNPSGSSYDGGMILAGPRNSSGLGNEQGINNNAIVKGQGGDHVTSSLITETGTATTFYTNALYVSSSGNVGIGTTSPVITAGYNTLTLGGTNAGQVTWNTGSSTIGYAYNDATNMNVGGVNALVLSTYSTGVPTERVRINSTGVGIGNISPTALLDVNGTVYVRGAGGLFSDVVTAYSGGNLSLGYGSSGNLIITGGSGGAERARITSAGNVGIGTATPVGGGGGSDRTLSINAATGAATFVTGLINGTRYSTLFTAANSVVLETNAAIPLAFNTNSTERMRIDSSGNVGIGTTSPSTNSRLHVYRGGGSYDTIIADGDAGTNTGFAIYEGGSARYALYSNGAGGNDSFNIYNFGAGSNSLTILTSGAATFSSSVTAGAYLANGSTTVSIPIDTGASKAYFDASSINGPGLTVRADSVGRTIRLTNDGSGSTVGAIDVNTNGLGIATNTSHPIIFSPQATERMRITTGGNVFIGTTTGDGYRLQINGGNQAAATFGQTFSGVAAYSQWVNSSGTFVMGLDGAAGATERMRISSGGAISLGAVGSVNGNIVNIISSGTTLYTSYRYSGTTDVGYIGNGPGLVAGGANGDFGIRAENNLLFAIGNTERMRINSSGNVGIGVTNQVAKLQVRSNNQAAVWFQTGDQSYIMLGKVIQSYGGTTNTSLLSFSVSGNTGYMFKIVIRGTNAVSNVAYEDVAYASWYCIGGGYQNSTLIQPTTVINIAGSHNLGTLSWGNVSTAPVLRYSQGSNGYILEAIDIYVAARDGGSIAFNVDYVNAG